MGLSDPEPSTKLTDKDLRAAIRRLRHANKNEEFIEIPVPCSLCGKPAMHLQAISGEDHPFCEECRPEIEDHLEWIEATNRWLEKLGDKPEPIQPQDDTAAIQEAIDRATYPAILKEQQRIAGS
jgi:hypothetical protein